MNVHIFVHMTFTQPATRTTQSFPPFGISLGRSLMEKAPTVAKRPMPKNKQILTADDVILKFGRPSICSYRSRLVLHQGNLNSQVDPSISLFFHLPKWPKDEYLRISLGQQKFTSQIRKISCHELNNLWLGKGRLRTGFKTITNLGYKNHLHNHLSEIPKMYLGPLVPFVRNT